MFMFYATCFQSIPGAAVCKHALVFRCADLIYVFHKINNHAFITNSRNLTTKSNIVKFGDVCKTNLTVVSKQINR